MRFEDFINEASIFTKPGTYTYGHKVNVAVNNKNMGQKILKAIQEFDPSFTGNEELEWIKPVSKPSHTVYVGKGTDQRFFKLPDGKIIAIVGADKAIQGGLTHAKGQKGSTAENAGDASEPVLSAAVVAKLIKRGQDSIADITADDVKNILSQAINDPSLSFEVNDKNSKIADTIKFTIEVKKPTLDFLSDPAFWNSKMGALLPSVVHYANSGQMDRYADFFYKNGKVDMIHVKSDGVSEAKERKTDIEATVNGRPLKGMNVSLKAGSPHIGQVGGGQIKNPKAAGYIVNNAKDLFGPFGVEITPPKVIKDKVQFWVNAYKQAAKQLKSMLKGDDAKSEAGVVVKIANFVAGHGTSGDPNIKLVSLGTKGVSTVHSFKNLQRKLIADDIDLDCEYREGRSKVRGDPRPELRVFDKNTGKAIMYIRYSSTEDETKIWNTVEMKELLKELTTLTYIKTERDRYDTSAETPVRLPDVKPVATASAPTQAWTAPTANKPAFVAPALTGKGVNTLQAGEWKSADELEDKFDNRHDVGIAEEVPAEDKDVTRLKKLAGIRSFMSKGV